MRYLLLVLLLVFPGLVMGAVRAKIAFLAPEGSSWGKVVKAMAKEINKETEGEVRFKVYFGGVAGDEPDVLRKIRIAQLQGGIFTGKTLADIYPDSRVIEIPFSFHDDRALAWKTLNDLTPFFNEEYSKRGMKNLGFFEVGKVYFVSQKKVENLKGLSGIKIWAWEGDRVVAAMLKTMGLISVPLALPDVLSSLSTGIIEAAYASPMAMVALQWHSKIKYLIDYPLAFSVAAFLVDQETWNKIPNKYQTKVEQIVKKYMEQANEQTARENEEALGMLKAGGVEFITFPESDQKTSTDIRSKVVSSLIKEKVFSAQIIERVEKIIKEKKK